MISHTFKTEADAREAVQDLNQWGRQRNNGNQIGLREGCRVYLRPEYAGPITMRELAKIAGAF